MTGSELITAINEGAFNSVFSELYPDSKSAGERYRKLIRELGEKAEGIRLFSAPGRTELGGNHTDHNHGKVLAASVHLDSIAAAVPRTDSSVIIRSEGYPTPFRVDLSDLSVKENEKETTEALIRGVAAGMADLGLTIGGFEACISSNVLRGSGLSSSASIEILLGTIFDHLFNEGTTDPVTLAKVGKQAENLYFGKPSGLMDQVACAYGGIVSIDFADTENPVVRKVDFSFEKKGFVLAVVDTGGSHANLTSAYASIPEEMKAVAAVFGQNYLRGIGLSELLDKAPELRKKAGDRAILRAMHFITDNYRVDGQIGALSSDNIQSYLQLVNESGRSSWMLLQNCQTPGSDKEQMIPLALATAGHILSEEGAVRVHGGGFAGTIQAYIPLRLVERFTGLMESLFGEASVTPLLIRSVGATEVKPA